MNILQVNKYGLLIKEERQNKLSLLFLLQEHFRKTKKNDFFNQSKEKNFRLVALTNKDDDRKDNYKNYLKKQLQKDLMK